MRALDIGSLIVFHRKKAGLTQIELAQLSGVSRFVVQDIEAGTGSATAKWSSSIIRIDKLGRTIPRWLKSTKPMPCSWIIVGTTQSPMDGEPIKETAPRLVEGAVRGQFVSEG